MITIKAIKYFQENKRVRFGYKIGDKKYFIETSELFLNDPEIIKNMIKADIFEKIQVEVIQ